MSALRFPVPAMLLPLALALAGCGSTGALNVASTSMPASAPAPRPVSDGKVDEVTRGILMAAGLDPSEPGKPREIRKQVAAVVQVRYRGRNYGTALARPTPGRIAFVDPAAVANQLAGPMSRAELTRVLKGQLVDVASQDCKVDGRAARKVRKAFRLPKVCPEPSGEIWADLNRMEMAVDLHIAPRLAAMVQAPTGPGLAAPTLFAAQAEAAQTEAEPDGTAPIETPAAPARTRTAVNLLTPDTVAAIAQTEPQPAAAPVSPAAAVVLPPLPKPAPQTSEPPPAQPWNALLAPTPAAQTPAPAPVAQPRAPVVLAAPAQSIAPPQPAAPAVALVATAGAMQPVAYSRGTVSETDEAYVPGAGASPVRVVSDSYQPPPTGTTKFFHTRY